MKDASKIELILLRVLSILLLAVLFITVRTIDKQEEELNYTIDCEDKLYQVLMEVPDDVFLDIVVETDAYQEYQELKEMD